MAIGSGWQAIVAYVNLATYYVIGLPIGCVLGFKTSLGVAVSSINLFLSLNNVAKNFLVGSKPLGLLYISINKTKPRNPSILVSLCFPHFLQFSSALLILMD